MPKFIKMPKLSDTMTEGTLAKWNIKEGDTIKHGQGIADVETDKATMEMQSYFDGKVIKLLLQAGGKVTLGGPMAVVLEEDEELPANLDELIAAASAESVKAPAPTPEKGDKAVRPGKETAPAGLNLPPRSPSQARRPAAGPANGVRVKASPLARKIAEEKGVDLGRVTGTGPGGRIIREDVENAPVGGTSGGGAPAKAVQTIRPVAGPDDERVAVSGMRAIIADRLSASKTQIPHFYLNIEVDSAPLSQFRAHLNATNEKSGGNKYSINDFILKAVVRAAQAVPAVNAAWDGDAVVKYKHVGLSVAIAVEDGLLTPVIKEANNKTLLQISQAVKDLAGRAKTKKISPDEFAGGTITVSNLGAYGIDTFSAIINPPQAAIISVGSIRKVPVVNDKGAIVAGERMWVGLSGDHRVVDGAVAATYLAELRKLLENPALMLV
ncbi:MAG: Acetyltransferase component of pyruvate dehydrogenase complex [Verrucomicrobiaceae bacterium]|nr:Acetyltransferase component of pyruvate dehydrogenase complex [Verrucomicrobiaceae bacterium]